MLLQSAKYTYTEDFKKEKMVSHWLLASYKESLLPSVYLFYLFYVYRWPMWLEVCKNKNRVPDTCQMQEMYAIVPDIDHLLCHYGIWKGISSEALPSTCLPKVLTLPPF